MTDSLTNGAPGQVISRRLRWLLGSIAFVSWGLGAAAAFLGDGVGAAALVVCGASTGVIASIGRWPSRVVIQGTEFAWTEVRQTVDSHIAHAQRSGDADVLRELLLLRNRLDVLAKTGTVTEHPAEIYDQDVMRAFRRAFPDGVLRRSGARSREVADFSFSWQGHEVLVETKWRQDPDTPFRGGTLEKLVSRLPNGALLLVVVNARDVQQARDRLDVSNIVVQPWLTPDDDQGLVDAIDRLVGANRAPS